MNVWSPVLLWNGNNVGLAFDDVASLTGQVVVPGTSQPGTTNTITVEILGAGGGHGLLGALDKDGKVLESIVTSGGPGPHGGVLETLTAPHIQQFWVSRPGDDPLADPKPWGVAQIDVGPTTVAAPEPSTLVLALLGALGVGALRAAPFSACRWKTSKP